MADPAIDQALSLSRRYTDAPRDAEVRPYDFPWYQAIPHAITDMVYGPNANAQQGEWMSRLFGTRNPINAPGQISEGIDTARQGYRLGDYEMMGRGGAEAALAALPLAGLRVAPRMNPRPAEMYPQGPWDMTRREFQSAMDEMPKVMPYTFKEPAPIGAKTDIDTLENLQNVRAREGLYDLERFGRNGTKNVESDAWVGANPYDVQRELKTLRPGKFKASDDVFEEMSNAYKPDGSVDWDALAKANEKYRAEERAHAAKNDGMMKELGRIIGNDHALRGLNRKVNQHYSQEPLNLQERLDSIKQKLDRLENSPKDNWPKGMPRPYGPEHMGIEPVVEGTLLYGILKGAGWKPAPFPFGSNE